MENEESTPPSARASVKCFSMTVAPRATAATAAPAPIVWSESPTSQPKRSRRSGMVRMLVLCAVAGYVLVVPAALILVGSEKASGE